MRWFLLFAMLASGCAAARPYSRAWCATEAGTDAECDARAAGHGAGIQFKLTSGEPWRWLDPDQEPRA
jgi:hypothetical protein